MKEEEASTGVRVQYSLPSTGQSERVLCPTPVNAAAIAIQKCIDVIESENVSGHEGELRKRRSSSNRMIVDEIDYDIDAAEVSTNVISLMQHRRSLPIMSTQRSARRSSTQSSGVRRTLSRSGALSRESIEDDENSGAARQVLRPESLHRFRRVKNVEPFVREKKAPNTGSMSVAKEETYDSEEEEERELVALEDKRQRQVKA